MALTRKAARLCAARGIERKHLSGSTVLDGSAAPCLLEQPRANSAQIVIAEPPGA